MTLIEGIGDEVIQFFILLAIVLIALIAWWSTNISERPLMRTVLILERRSARNTSTESQSSLGESRDTSEASTEVNNHETEEKTSQSDSDTNNQIEVNVVENFDNIVVNGEEMQSTISSCDETPNQNCPSEEREGGGSGDNKNTDESVVVRNRRIAFFQPKEESAEVSKRNECLKQIIEEKSTSKEYEAHSSEEGNIRIWLKYLNDDSKLVKGTLQEQLGDFKRRHFSLELAGRKLVRLIFNGKVLQQDSQTLQNYGFFDNCVVHCVVHQPRTPPPSPTLNRPRNETQTQNENDRHWDPENILFTSLGFLLVLAWYSRYQYAQYFSVLSTVSLMTLTGMFTLSVLGQYI